jgi:hypothetical protein
LPEDKALPAPANEYFEMETAKAFHYPGWGAWLAEAPQVRAKLMAHELHKGMRDSYHFEMRTEETGPQTTAPKKTPWQEVRERFMDGRR